MIELEPTQDSRYPNKPRYRVWAVDPALKRSSGVWLGEIQQVIKSGLWFYNRRSGWDRTKQGQFASRREAITALVEAEHRAALGRARRAAEELRIVELGIEAGIPGDNEEPS